MIYLSSKPRYDFPSVFTFLGHPVFFIVKRRFRQRLHGTGSVWNPYEIDTVKPFVYTGPAGSVRIESAIWYQMGPLMKVIPYGPYRSSFEPVPCRSVTNRIPFQTDLNISDPL